jgi:hypothetical protein
MWSQAGQEPDTAPAKGPSDPEAFQLMRSAFGQPAAEVDEIARTRPYSIRHRCRRSGRQALLGLPI